MAGSTVADNTASYSGGGLYAFTLSVPTVLDIANSTFSSNEASTSGGGISLSGVVGGTIATTITSTTITENRGDYAGGIYQYSGGGASLLTNTIVAENWTADGSTPADVWGTFDSNSSYNLIGAIDGSTNLDGPSVISGTAASPLDAGLAPLGNYGGPTQTHVPLLTSLAIGAGSNAIADAAGLVHDQRGEYRVYGGYQYGQQRVDMGAAEAHTSPLIVDNPADDDDDNLDAGEVTLREALRLATHPEMAGLDVITFAASLTGGQIDLMGSALEIDSDVEIRGLGADVLKVNAGKMSRVFNVHDGINARITGLTMTGGNVSGDGGGIYTGFGSELTLDSVAIEENSVDNAADIYIGESSTLTVANSSISNNTNSEFGATIDSSASAGNQSYTNVTISGNIGIGYEQKEGSEVTFVNSTISNNSQNGLRNLHIASSLFPLLESTIVVGNGLDDLVGEFDPLSSFNLIGSGEFGGITDNTNGNRLGIAVGTAVAGGPPHRSGREELHSYGSCLESSAKTEDWIRMNDSRIGQMTPRKTLHPRPR